jgi:hypothetical protein
VLSMFDILKNQAPIEPVAPIICNILFSIFKLFIIHKTNRPLIQNDSSKKKHAAQLVLH